ncbi:glycoside hydrolase family 130 protein [Mucilaginibacter sp. L3T2-6]|uniref:glycoside hydrolase family 130 protein n=1 Tax=Mucilaginibacter sp. L3T2-6 TaxID=3062491 RepID=UPI00267649E4|nr:glycoside hydrolase family 130 protein [Mucilaginibacter sp. L3T2-6]MDO3644657.1 glycoside hydrolase family 130 protein [Mucilaginibacter sp. L3T2-6]MDV6217109.1 glycoside hydrolase family 130 protein [Mucilaginibacter sp. L3T2-6]
MRLFIERKPIRINPDPKRVIARFFFNGNDRAKEVIQRVMEIDEDTVFGIVSPLLQEYSKRHRNITRALNRHCSKLKPLFTELDIDYDALTVYRKLLIGSYFTHEYSIESAAFFNPSIVEDPDQTELLEGERRVIISFRAVGEGHISSITFRRALIDQANNITVSPAGSYIDEAEIVRNAVYNKKLFFEKAAITQINIDVLNELESKLDHHFEYANLRRIIIDSQKLQESDITKLEYDKVLWLADSYYEIVFSLDTDISDRVIFPISEYERKGIEDARFVHFKNDDDSTVYYATYTAYDGSLIMPKLLQTNDFYNFKIMPLYGAGAQNKNLALFPRKINGKYAMISRIDGINNYIMYSDKINIWEKPIKLQHPKFSWEFIQIGNCGSPIETDQGWIVITHGVGPMRRYVLGASLLKLDDPEIEIGRLKEPLLIPTSDEREGYVPNVLYSCGALVHNGKLIIPYGVSDSSTAFAEVDLKELISKLIADKKETDRTEKAKEKVV